MAVDIKVAPDEKLELVKTYITDTNPNSDYFVISELPDTFSGGKNAFLIAGSDKLVSNSEIKLQIKDANGKVCYVEYSNGNPEYYEGNSKVVAVYIYPTLTAFGPATITILGQLKDAPPEWNGLYSVKWQTQININPALANTTRVRFYKRPAVFIKEILQPLYSIVSGSKVASLVTQSFASITVNQLETFAGDVARVKVYRTSEGDISDYELIQDISVESKNLLTTYALSGSVVGNAGIFGPDSLSKVWNTGSLNAVLNSTYINDGLQLSGSGKLTYTSSLTLLSSNTYELELDTFFTGSTATNLVAYISGTQNGAVQIVSFSGSVPTKNFGTTTTAFTIPKDEPTASLYLSQSVGNWHVGNISLNLSQDTAFSPNEISFITSMPTVLGNETFNFKFEFYDVNNNYVPVAVTQSALFNGGNNNIGGTLLIVSSSTSASNAYTNQLSKSVGYDLWFNPTGSLTSSVSHSYSASVTYTTITSASLQSSSLYISSSLSSSISSSISTSIAFTSQSVYNGLSSSYARVQQLADGGYSGSFISGNIIYAPVVGGQLGYFSTLFRVGQEPNSIYLDARTTTRKIYIGGVNSTGSYNSGSTKVYMDSAGQFSLGNQMLWDGASLTVNGTINVTGGNAATQTYASGTAFTQANSAYSNAKAVADSIAAGTYSGGTLISNNSIISPIIAGSAGYFSSTFRVGNGGITLDGVNKLIYIGTGIYNNSNTPFYVDNSGNFSLKDKLTFDGTTLTVNGTINVTGGNAATSASVYSVATTSANNAYNSAVSTASGSAYTMATTSANTAYTNASASAYTMATTAANTAYSNAKAVADSIAAGTYSGGTLISGGSIISPVIAGSSGYFSSTFRVGNGGITLDGVNKLIYVGAGNYANADTPFYVDNSSNFSLGSKLTWDGSTLSINGTVTATNGTIGGWSIGSTFLRSSDTLTIMDSTNKEFAVKWSTNPNYYKVRIGAGTSFTSQAFVPMTEINESGLRVSVGVDSTSTGLFANVQGYNDPANSNRGTSLSVYSSIDYSVNQWTPIYARLFGNYSGVASSVPAGQFEGGILTRNDTIPGSSNAVNQGYALITQGYSYLNVNTSDKLFIGFLPVDSTNTRALRIKTSGEINRITTDSSSRKYKKNIETITDDEANRLLNLRVVTYNEKVQNDGDVKLTGLIAEEVSELGYDDFVAYGPNKEPENVNYQQVFATMISVVQKLEKRVFELEQQLKNK